MRRIFFLAFVAVFILQGTLLACLNPSFKKVVTATPMACCAKLCQKKTSQEEAQTACNRSALQANQSDGFIQTANLFGHSPFIGLLPISSKSSPLFFMDHTPRNTDDSQRRRSLPLYLSSHAFLI
ncbi:MAG: hypothetical protein HY037_01555 [Nitrospirae bacterium]|nr:hypothetical protein [Candidatus Troglogloeales bacterium]